MHWWSSHVPHCRPSGREHSKYSKNNETRKNCAAKSSQLTKKERSFLSFFWRPNLWVKINAERAVSECRRLRFTFSTDSSRFKRCTAHFQPPNFVRSNRALIKRGYDSEPAKRRKRVPENLPCRWKSMKFATLRCIAAIIASGSDVLMWKSYKFPVSLTLHKLARAHI